MNMSLYIVIALVSVFLSIVKGFSRQYGDCRQRTQSAQFMLEMVPSRPSQVITDKVMPSIKTIVLGTFLSSMMRGKALAADQAYGFTVLPSGLEVSDVKVGDGAEAVEGKTVQFQWVLRRSNGYFVDASSNYGDDEVFIYKVGNLNKVIAGVDEGIRGMKVGGVRALKIPPQLAYQMVGDDSPGPMPAGFGPRRQILTRIKEEKWYFQMKLVKVK